MQSDVTFVKTPSGEGSAPDEFICPLTLEIMTDPVMDAHGNNFEKKAIWEWMYEGNTTCPLTRRDLKPKDLVRNVALRLKIENWRKKYNLALEGVPRPRKDDDNDEYCGLLNLVRPSKDKRVSPKLNSLRSKLRRLEAALEDGDETGAEVLVKDLLKSFTTNQLVEIDAICEFASDAQILEPRSSHAVRKARCFQVFWRQSDG